MKFSNFLTEATSTVWVLFPEIGHASSKFNVRDVFEAIELFSSETKLVNRLFDLMEEVEDVLTRDDLNDTTSIKQFEALIKKHKELKHYADILVYKSIKVK